MGRDSQNGLHINKNSIEWLFPKHDIDILGYESPIKVAIGQMRIEQENGIVKAIQEQGITVDKDELIKALQYDRGQYDKGYINGYNRKASDVAEKIFAEIDKRFEALLKFYPCNGEFEDAKKFVDFHWKHIRHSIMCDYDAELKKKYTEEEG